MEINKLIRAFHLAQENLWRQEAVLKRAQKELSDRAEEVLASNQTSRGLRAEASEDLMQLRAKGQGR